MSEPEKKPLHRIGEVCRREGISPRTLGRRLSIDCPTVRRLRNPTSDIRLSDLHRVAEGIGVPTAELVADVDANEAQRLRGLLVRISKVANTLLVRLTGADKRLVESLKAQIDEELPSGELGCLPVCDGRRALNEPSMRDETVIPTTHLECDWLNHPLLTGGPG